MEQPLRCHQRAISAKIAQNSKEMRPTHLDELLRVAEVGGDVIHEPLPLGRLQHVFPEVGRLWKRNIFTG